MISQNQEGQSHHCQSDHHACQKTGRRSEFPSAVLTLATGALTILPRHRNQVSCVECGAQSAASNIWGSGVRGPRSSMGCSSLVDWTRVESTSFKAIAGQSAKWVGD